MSKDIMCSTFKCPRTLKKICCRSCSKYLICSVKCFNNPEICKLSSKKEGGTALNYIDNQGNKIFVSSGFGLNKFGTFKVDSSGGLCLINSILMPLTGSKEEAQKNLNYYAKKNNLKKADD